MKTNVVVLSGAGISAESGLSTFRGNNGLWENHRIEEVATPEAWKKNPTLVHKFYNQRREALKNAMPNEAHLQLKKLEKEYNVVIITQNVDDLHEKAKSSNIIHLHGELTKARSEKNETIVKHIGYKSLSLKDTAEDGAKLRPAIVWFGEAVPKILEAGKIVEKADYLIIVGTSLNVYPASGLVNYFNGKEIFLIDPNYIDISNYSQKINFIQKKATIGVKEVVENLLK